MAFNERQELRQKLLLEAVNSLDDPKAALALAQEMERFVIEGIAGSSGPVPSSRSAAVAEGGAGSGKKPRWTRSDELQLRELWVSGHPIPDIARQLGRSEVSIGSRARQLSLPTRTERHRTKPVPPKETNIQFGGANPPVRINQHTPGGQWSSDGSGSGEGPES